LGGSRTPEEQQQELKLGTSTEENWAQESLPAQEKMRAEIQSRDWEAAGRKEK
jgi:hypothetical protein